MRSLARSVALTVIVMSAVALLVCDVARADGFRNPVETPSAQGRAGARYTQADDASTVTYNPANLMDLEEPSVLTAVTFGYTKVDYTAPWGQSEETKSPW